MIIAAARTAKPFYKSRAVCDDDAATCLVLAYFRETNAEGLRLRARLAQAIEKTKSSDVSSAAVAFIEVHEVICTEIEEARRRAASIEDLRDSQPATIAWYARELVQVRNAWDDLEQLWGPTKTLPAPLPELVACAHDSIKVIDAVVFTCACQTIPDELDHYLENYRIGTCLNFITTFQDQLPDEAATRAVLATLAPQSGIVSGLIDLGSAKVIKADQRWWRQMVSLAVVAATAVLGFVLIAIAVHLGTWFQFAPSDWPVTPNQFTALSGAYVLVLLGVLGHWILDRVKQNRAGADVTPFSEWLLWIHVNEVPITVRIATVWLMVGLGFAFQTFNINKGIQPLTYFTAGYFIDSTYDALIGRLNSFISANDPEKKKAEKAKS